MSNGTWLTNTRGAPKSPTLDEPASTARAIDKINEARAVGQRMMDDAGLLVMGKGWLPSECVIKHSRGKDGATYETMVVTPLNLEVFEVKRTTSRDGNTITVTTTPRVIGWPGWHPRSPYKPSDE